MADQEENSVFQEQESSRCSYARVPAEHAGRLLRFSSAAFNHVECGGAGNDQERMLVPRYGTLSPSASLR